MMYFKLNFLAFKILIISPELKLESTTAASRFFVRYDVREIVAMLLNLFKKHISSPVLESLLNSFSNAYLALLLHRRFEKSFPRASLPNWFRIEQWSRVN